jgi:hypothetical protein
MCPDGRKYNCNGTKVHDLLSTGNYVRVYGKGTEPIQMESPSTVYIM